MGNDLYGETVPGGAVVNNKYLSLIRSQFIPPPIEPFVFLPADQERETIGYGTPPDDWDEVLNRNLTKPEDNATFGAGVVGELGGINANPSFENPRLGPTGLPAPSSWFGYESSDVLSYLDPLVKEIVEFTSQSSIRMVGAAIPVVPRTTYTFQVLARMTGATGPTFSLDANELDAELVGGERVIADHSGSGADDVALFRARTRSQIVIGSSLLTNSFVVYSAIYTPTATAIWFSPDLNPAVSSGQTVEIEWVIIKNNATLGAVWLTEVTGEQLPAFISRGGFYYNLQFTTLDMLSVSLFGSATAAIVQAGLSLIVPFGDSSFITRSANWNQMDWAKTRGFATTMRVQGYNQFSTTGEISIGTDVASERLGFNIENATATTFRIIAHFDSSGSYFHQFTFPTTWDYASEHLFDLYCVRQGDTGDVEWRVLEGGTEQVHTTLNSDEPTNNNSLLHHLNIEIPARNGTASGVFIFNRWQFLQEP